MLREGNDRAAIRGARQEIINAMNDNQILNAVKQHIANIDDNFKALSISVESEA